MPTLTDLFIYPVKSLRGCRVESADLDGLGLVGDRRFLVVDPAGRFMTQRTLPRMALIETALTADSLTLSAPGAGSVSVARASDPAAPLRTVSVWSSAGLQAEDCGEESSRWLSTFLDTPSRLVRAGAAFKRPVLKPGKARPGDQVTFADAYPLLVISAASLADLNDRLISRGEEAVPMDRFRPNLVVSKCQPYAEDTWTRFQIGRIEFRAGGPCARCIMTTTDQATAERGPEPLRLMSTYRRDAADPTHVNFGQNLFHETKSGTLRVGDEVKVGPIS
jgi:uncharacterized protein YcbX